MNHYLENPKIKIKIEIELPSGQESPPRKFAVSRTLKAKWFDDPERVTRDILNEIKNYKGSFIGDIIVSLSSLVKSEGGPIKEENSRLNDVALWTSNIIDLLLSSGVRDKLHEELLIDNRITEWDGSSREINHITAEELRSVDIEKLLILLAPRIKHLLFLISKDF